MQIYLLKKLNYKNRSELSLGIFSDKFKLRDAILEEYLVEKEGITLDQVGNFMMYFQVETYVINNGMAIASVDIDININYDKDFVRKHITEKL